MEREYIHGENALDLVNDSGTPRFDTVGIHDCANIVGEKGIKIHQVTEFPKPLQIPTFCNKFLVISRG